ncbi:MAG: hypothetical protein LBC74_15260 [Planctomycetaceae bacterium]|nr:hypothetical protein [Planctomycetaceae bacterium]
MKKKILELGSSIVCSFGICLMSLVLVSVVVEKTFAEEEATPADCFLKLGKCYDYCSDKNCHSIPPPCFCE